MTKEVSFALKMIFVLLEFFNGHFFKFIKSVSFITSEPWFSLTFAYQLFITDSKSVDPLLIGHAENVNNKSLVSLYRNFFCVKIKSKLFKV